MILKVLFYVSNHGFGHFTRIYALAQEFAKAGIVSFITTNRAKSICDFNSDPFIVFRNYTIDCEIAQTNWQTPDGDRILDNLLNLFSEKETIINHETDFIKKNEVNFIIADIPFLACEIAHKAKIFSCVLSNFDWHEQLCQFLPENVISTKVLNDIKKMYLKANIALVLPFSGDTGMSLFRNSKKTGLLARYSFPDRDQICNVFKINPEKKIVLFSFTDNFQNSIQDILKINDVILLGKAKIKHINYRIVPEDFDYSFLISSVDAIITKAGYSTLAEACQHGKTIFYMTRKNFPEDKLLTSQLKSYPYAYEISYENWESLNWKELFEKIDLTHDAKKLLENSVFKNKNVELAQDCLKYYLNQNNYQDFLSDEYSLILEVGSNNIILLFARLNPESKSGFSVVHRNVLITKMAKNMKDSFLTEESIRVVKDNLKKNIDLFFLLSKEIYIIGTWASRNAKNIHKITGWLMEKYSLKYHILSEVEENYYNIEYCKDEFNYVESFGFDLGGGSTEFFYLNNNSVVFQHSLEIGIRTIKDRIKNNEMLNVENFVFSQLDSLPKIDNKGIVFIGIGGVFSSICHMIFEMNNSATPFISVHGKVINYNEIKELSD